MKYVAFLDILGFKETLKKMKQPEAAEYGPDILFERVRFIMGRVRN